MLKIKKNIGIFEKIELVNLIKDGCIYDGSLDVFKKEIASVYYISQFYSDFRPLKMNEANDDGEEIEVVDIVSSYDKLIHGGFYSDILKTVDKSEIETVRRLIEESIEEELRYNSYSSLIYRQFKDLNSVESLRLLASIDKTKVDEVMEIANKIT